MSFIILFLIKGKDIFVINKHYNTILKIINTDFKNIEYYLDYTEQPLSLDAGYLIVDTNTKTIVSNQSAFSKQHLKPSYAKDWFWIET